MVALLRSVHLYIDSSVVAIPFTNEMGHSVDIMGFCFYNKKKSLTIHVCKNENVLSQVLTLIFVLDIYFLV